MPLSCRSAQRLPELGDALSLSPTLASRWPQQLNRTGSGARFSRLDAGHAPSGSTALVRPCPLPFLYLRSSVLFLISVKQFRPCRSGKTTLLFHYAREQAAQGKAVVFLCKRNKMEEVAATMTHLKNDQALSAVGMR